MKNLAATALTAIALALFALPALARDSYVTDGASMLSQATVDTLNREIGDFNRQTGKEVVVVTVPTLSGQTVQAAAERAFAEQQVNGVLIYIAKAERQDLVIGDRASRAFFPTGAFTNIHDAMRAYFRQGDFDGGVTTGVNLVLDQYRSHERAAGAMRTQPVSRPLAPASSSQSTGGFHLSFFWLLIILLAGFLIIRALFRAMSGPRTMPPGYGGGPGYGPGYGGPGYGGGYGGGGGGSFFSGLLGGLGGAFLGNELFGGRGGGSNVAPGTDASGVAGDAGGGADAAGWQSDAGQADMGNAGGGGGFGGGDFGGGGGGGDGGGW
jgi:uncharacterized protein